MAYTNIDDPSAYFQTALYTGDGSTSRDITNDGNSDLQPDWVWIKQRSGSRGHSVYDSSRGVQKRLATDSTAVEATSTVQLSAFNADGFEIGSGNACNENAQTYAAWQWKCNAGSTSSNTDGTVTTTTQVNSDAGFSIVTWAGGGTGTLGHGLGETPDMWIIKNRDYAVSWSVGFSDSNILGGRSKYLRLNSTSAIESYNNLWGTSDGQISSTTIGAAGDRSINISGNDYVGYFFKAKQGYSKFGKYVGNGNTNGPFIYTGFKPAVIIHKSITTVKNWGIITGGTFKNEIDARLNPNLVGAEGTGTMVDFLSNGFKWRTTNGTANTNGTTYIYMAFAENPFVTSTGIPTTAR